MDTKEALEKFKGLSHDDKINFLMGEVYELKKEIFAMVEEEVKKELDIPAEVSMVITGKRANRIGYGPHVRPLLQYDIEEARKVTKSEGQAARHLGVSYPTFKKYCRLYGIEIKGGRCTNKGIPRPSKRKGGVPPTH